MICYFCNKKILNRAYLLYSCHTCNIHYYDYDHFVMYPKINKIKYFYFEFSSIPCAPYTKLLNEVGNVIATWNYKMDISPHNINQKLKLYTLFS